MQVPTLATDRFLENLSHILCAKIYNFMYRHKDWLLIYRYALKRNWHQDHHVDFFTWVVNI